MSESVTAVVLAAGKGTRMKSARAKVLHQVFFKPMLHYVLDAVQDAGIGECVLIVGHQRQAVLDSLAGYRTIPVFQEEQLGTGHAVLCAEKACADGDLVMILCGDTPLIRAETLQAMLSQHRRSQAALTLMTTLLEDPAGYGRIIQGPDGQVQAIVEQKDADEEELAIREINAGIYLARRDFLFSALREVGTDNAQGEVYLTDIVAIANRQGLRVRRFFHPEAIDVLGVNSRVELARAHGELQMRHNRDLMLAGVTIYSPETVLVSPDSSIGTDSVLWPGVQVTGRSRIGSGCTLESGCRIHKCHLADGAIVGANAVLHNCRIEDAQRIVPLTYRVG
ncbi:bifunctional N-acetylglucosamine-1-phosphate uridyltransferase/glucosamine-1-phosphate acetyltransferase [Thermodesulfobacteriota bacterium B35]